MNMVSVQKNEWFHFFVSLKSLYGGYFISPENGSHGSICNDRGDCKSLIAKMHSCMLHWSRFLLRFAHEKMHLVARADGLCDDFDGAITGNTC